MNHKEKVKLAKKLLFNFQLKYKAVGIKPSKGMRIFNNPAWSERARAVFMRVKRREGLAKFMAEKRRERLLNLQTQNG